LGSLPAIRDLLRHRAFSKGPWPREAVAKASRWHRWIVILGIVLPLVAIVESLVIGELKDRGYIDTLVGLVIVPLGSPASLWRPRSMGAVFLYALFIVADYPFLLITEGARRRILKLWPDARAARAAILGGVAGLVTAYLPLYVKLGAITVLDPRQALLLIAIFCLVAPLYAWGLAGIGWFCGHWIDRRTAT
jgi:hypothetical protein